jgi:type IV pilus assembly protein PilQ
MRKILLLSLLAAIFAFTSCSSQKIESDDEFSVEGGSTGDDLALDAGTTGNQTTDDLSLDEAPVTNPEAKASPGQDSDLALENELNSLDNGKQEPPPPVQNDSELSLDEPAQNPAGDTAQATPPPAQEPAQPPPPEIAQTEPPAPAVTEPVEQNSAPVPGGPPATITNVQYKGNANGGTIAIAADKPVTYTTRMNSTTNQFIVEVQNSVIPKKLKRTLNTKDMASSIGSVDIYEKAGSNISRFVIQLRPGSSDPVIQQEGNSLLVIGSSVNPSGEGMVAENPSGAPEATPAPEVAKVDSGSAGESTGSTVTSMGDDNNPAIVDVDEGQKTAEGGPKMKNGILNYENLDDFLMNNTKYYGKKVNFETYGWDTAEALKFLADEGNVNLMLDDSVLAQGKVNVKLRDVPWDQAFVVILKSKKLAYKRQGNVIRVGTLADLKKDEEDAIALKEGRKAPEPLAVKRFFISYADVSEIQLRIADYIKLLTPVDPKAPADQKSKAGQVLIDKRNNSIIVTDTEPNLKRVAEIIAALDTQPKQVQIEAKIIEANESFSRGLGVDWSGAATEGGAATGNSYTAGFGGGGTFGNFTWGHIDSLGAITAKIALNEGESKAKVLSSPRITVLSNTAATITSSVDVLIAKSTIVNGTTTVTQDRVPVGVTLGVTPVANNGGTVKMLMNIQRSAPAGGGAIATRSAQTELFVRSGTTAVIGGIYNTTLDDSESGVPVLRHVPVFGTLFKRTDTTQAKSELLMFVTPTILRPL